MSDNNSEMALGAKLPEVNTSNEFLLGVTSRGLHTYGGKPCIRTMGIMPYFTTKQCAYRFAAWLVLMAEVLPDEDLASTFEEIKTAIANT